MVVSRASGQAPPPPDSELAQTVARVSLISGGVSFSRGDDPDQWDPADVNVPMTLGDRVWTGDGGRIELQVHGGNVVRLSAGTDLQALNLTDEVKQFSLALGTASIAVRRLSDNEVFEIDTPNAAITLERPGDYRLDVDADGNTRVQVRDGRAIASAGGGQVPLAAGQQFDVAGIDAPRYDVAALPPPDGWDRWVADRNRRIAQARSYQYVTADIAGVEDLDRYGRWRQVPGFGWAWSPASVETGWAHIAPAGGSGRTRGDGPGWPPSRGAGLPITTDAGRTGEMPGTGSRWLRRSFPFPMHRPSSPSSEVPAATSDGFRSLRASRTTPGGGRIPPST